MKTNLVRMAALAVAAITMAVPVFAGQALVERDTVLLRSLDPGSALSWEMRPAEETGSLPVGNGKQMKSVNVAKTEVPAVKIDGTEYRIGIDTP